MFIIMICMNKFINTIHRERERERERERLIRKNTVGIHTLSGLKKVKLVGFPIPLIPKKVFLGFIRTNMSDDLLDFSDIREKEKKIK